ncbi:MAG: DNA polymerase IV [Acidobacteriota bacterium]
MGADWPRKILHIDLDAFYPSVEVLDHPELEGRPVIVGGLGRRGVVASASYEARKYGVHSAMPMASARRLCPDGVYLRSRFDRYRQLSRKVFDIYEAWTERVEPLSLDEAYLDVSRHISSPVDIAKSIKFSIRRKTRLTASAGISGNKFLAKLASDLDKPDGLTVIDPPEASRFLAPLPVEKLWGVGPATAEMLRKAGYETIGAVAAADPAALIAMIGRGGRQLWDFAQGCDERQVEPPGVPKSISSETTFELDLPSWDEAWPSLEKFARELAGKLRHRELMARTVTLKVRFQDFTTITRTLTPAAPLGDVGELLGVARQLAGRVVLAGRRIRLVGLGVSRLVSSQPQACGGQPTNQRQLGLWDG